MSGAAKPTPAPHGGALIPGVPVTLGALVYTMPPAGFDTLELHADAIDKHFLGQASAPTGLPREQIRLAVDLVHGALKRNYPDLDRAVVAANITVDSAAALLQLAVTQSLPPAPAGEAAGEGASTLGESTGAASAPP